MCSIDWGLLADWITALTSVGVFIVALHALRSWRDQLQGTTRHTVAQQVATAARALRYAFYAARSPFIDAMEFPNSYRMRPAGATPSNDERSAEYAHVYRNRWSELWPYIQEVVKLRAACGAIFGDNVAKAAEDLAKKARELNFYMQEHVEQLRVGPTIVAQWTDQEFVTKVKNSIKVHEPPNDTYSTEFEVTFEALLSHVRPHLH